MTKTHYQRPPLPWHGPLDALTACGLPVRPGMTVASLPQLGRMMRSDRYHEGLCQTCAGRAGYVPTWEQDPVGLLTTWLSSGSGGGKVRQRVVRELRAVGNVIATNPDLYAAEMAMAALSRLGGA